MNISFINSSYRRFYNAHKEELDEAWNRCVSTGTFILGPDVEKFEENLAQFVGTKYAVALNSGTDAIYLALKALGAKDKHILVPYHTFKATCGAALNAGAKVSLMDMDGKVKAIMPGAIDIEIIVHIAGELSEVDPMLDGIEDACQALGAVKNPTTDAQCWSFYPAKILGAYGDAGAVTTNNYSVYEYIKEARNHFKGDNRDFGINSRMDNLQAAILNVKFKYLPEFLARRKEIAEMYLEGLEGVDLPNNQKGRVWQDFIIRMVWNNDGQKFLYPDKSALRNDLYEWLKTFGIETMKNEYPFSPEYPKLPLAAKYEAETLRLPCNPDLTFDEINYVIEKINAFFS